MSHVWKRVGVIDCAGIECAEVSAPLTGLRLPANGLLHDHERWGYMSLYMTPYSLGDGGLVIGKLAVSDTWLLETRKEEQRDLQVPPQFAPRGSPIPDGWSP